MLKYVLIPGEKIGRLSVIRELGKIKKDSRKTYVLCLCSCGLEVVRDRNSLITCRLNNVECACKDCGKIIISNNGRSRADQIQVGRRFGEWTVVGVVTGLGLGTRYLTRCSCGKEGKILGANLLNGSNNSCFDCSAKIRHARKDKPLVGDKYRSFTVIEELRRRLPNGRPYYVYVCRCDCGSLSEKKPYELKRTNQGCIKCYIRVCAVCGCRGHKNIDIDNSECDHLGFCEKCDKFDIKDIKFVRRSRKKSHDRKTN